MPSSSVFNNSKTKKHSSIGKSKSKPTVIQEGYFHPNFHISNLDQQETHKDLMITDSSQSSSSKKDTNSESSSSSGD